MSKSERGEVRACTTLLFGTAGTPHSAKPRDSVTAMGRLRELGLDAMELEYVRGSFPSREKAADIAHAAAENGIRLTAHGPYFINLNAVEPEKRAASRDRVYKTALYGSLSGAESITFHAGFFLKQPADTVFAVMEAELRGLAERIAGDGIDVDIRPEVTGKTTQFGSLGELCALSRGIDSVLPCVDWSHLHARTGGRWNTAERFQDVLDTLTESLGPEILHNMHMHVSGIEYTQKGERKHLDLEDADFNYRELLRVLHDNDVRGILICESPSIEKDALLLKSFYDSL